VVAGTVLCLSWHAVWLGPSQRSGLVLAWIGTALRSLVNLCGSLTLHLVVPAYVYLGSAFLLDLVRFGWFFAGWWFSFAHHTNIVSGLFFFFFIVILYTLLLAAACLYGFVMPRTLKPSDDH
jgi:hypothetical protein